jgi:predicted DCC family thiol-disulfide oxidoreductase YuxK
MLEINPTPLPHPILLFDGVCNLCSTLVQFVIQRDPEGFFHFASLQSETGQQYLRRFHLPTNDFDSFIYIDTKNNRYYSKSSAALRVLRHLKGLWFLLYVFILVPPFLRNPIYHFVAKYRYRWFGKQEMCMIPSPEIESRFL